jgi:hypothetical protein
MVEIKMNSAAYYGSGARASVDYCEPHAKRVVNGIAWLDKPHGMDDYFGPISGEEFFSCEVNRLASESGVPTSSKPESESEGGYRQGGERRDNLFIGVKERALADEETARALLMRIGGFVACGILFAIGIALAIRV